MRREEYAPETFSEFETTDFRADEFIAPPTNNWGRLFIGRRSRRKDLAEASDPRYTEPIVRIKKSAAPKARSPYPND
jgi:hypothetical protein